MKKITYRILITFCILGIIGVFSGLSPTPSYAESLSQPPPTEQLEGILNIVYGDPSDNIEETIINIGLLDLTTKEEIVRLRMGIGLAHTYMGQAVQVEVARTSSISQVGEPPAYLVRSITPITPSIDTPQGISTPQMTGSQPFINLLCKFPDVAGTPRNPGDYAPLFDNTYGGIDNFWRNMSYDAINLLGTTTASAWVTLPQPKSYYVPATGNPNLFFMLRDCANAADSIVNFAPFVGVNLMLNDSIGCCAWGGGPYYIANDGGKFMRTTWNPPWAQGYGVIAHETGHALGLPHSSGPVNNPPSELSIYVSQWDVMSAKGDCSQSEAPWGCIPAGTIAYYLTLNNWIPANRKISIPTGTKTTITLRRVRENVGSGYILATIPVNDSSTVFYSVEVRDISGYDTNVPATAVLIHEINLSRTGNTGPALVVDDDHNTAGINPLLVDNNDGNNNVNDAGSQWQTGETFTDFANRISVRVVSNVGSDYVVEIKNNYTIRFTENELLAYLQANATGGIEYLLVDYWTGSAVIFMRVGTETVRAEITTNNLGGSLVRFNLVGLTNEAIQPLLPATTDVVTTHFLVNLNKALDGLVATEMINADIEAIYFYDGSMGVAIVE